MIRFFDWFLSIFGLLLALPLILIILLIGFVVNGVPIFIQKRIGIWKKPFKLIKFRTMKKSAPSVATHLAPKDSITKFGTFLRKTKLDEIPQLINILKGEMSIVGPRPCLPEQEELIREREKLGVYEVLPGITGLAQINDIDMSNPKLLAEWDAKMIASFSICNYFKYIILTLIGKGQGDRIKP